jgi:DNA-binding response OmpR family regulator
MSQDGTKKRPAVLLVDDDIVACEALAAILRGKGYDAECASTVAEGLERLDGKSFAILDMDLPDGLGLSILRKVRADNLPTKVAICSGSVDEEVLGAERPDKCFGKPVVEDQLLAWLTA